MDECIPLSAELVDPLLRLPTHYLFSFHVGIFPDIVIHTPTENDGKGDSWNTPLVATAV